MHALCIYGIHHICNDMSFVHIYVCKNPPVPVDGSARIYDHMYIGLPEIFISRRKRTYIPAVCHVYMLDLYYLCFNRM
jgi:hypothetical protein